MDSSDEEAKAIQRSLKEAAANRAGAAAKRKAAAAAAATNDSSSSSSDSSDSSSDSDSEAEAIQPVTDAREVRERGCVQTRKSARLHSLDSRRSLVCCALDIDTAPSALLCSSRSAQISVDLATLNPSFTCKLCGGYFREAHTIVDCLHIFCKSCLERHIVTTRKNDVVACPIRQCHSRLVATHPMKTEVRFDRVMQNLVDKLLPRYKEADEQLKKEIAAQFGGNKDDAAAAAKRSAALALAANSEDGGAAGGSSNVIEPLSKRPRFGDDKFGHEKLMIFELRPYVPPGGSSAANADSIAPALPYPFVKASAKVTVKYLRKFIAERLGLNPATNPLEVQCAGEVLGQDHSIEFIWRTRWQVMHVNQHLVLTYRKQEHVI